jgi:tetratricopeptide (TPR) repeat protein
MQDSASFWTDIKKLEEQLDKSPDSYCFARLSDVYLKVGLIDDALHVARQGVKKHPAYLSGQRALSFACYAKGLNDEALATLKRVCEVMPEDVSSQKVLGRLYVDAGNRDAACQVFRTALEFAPEDVECRIELESLENSTESTDSPLFPAEDDIIDDLEVLEELEVFEDEQLESECRQQEVVPEPDAVSIQHHDPLSTGTLAELYVSQGFIDKALEIYRAILDNNPEDQDTASRVSELQALEAVSSEVASESALSYEEETEDEATFSVPVDKLIFEDEPTALQECAAVPVLENQQICTVIPSSEDEISAIPQQGVADNALATFDGWLENIRRIKSCR